MSVSFRFIHAADLHVDSPFRGLSEAPSYVQEALFRSTFDAVHNLVQTAISNEVDFVVIAGDLYDTSNRSLRAQLALQREWQQLHAHGVQLFVIHGNHDHLSGSRANLKWPENVYTFHSDSVQSVPAFRRDGQLAAYIYGMSYGSRAVTDNIAAGYKPNTAEEHYHIALLHGNVDGSAEHDPYAPCSLVELAGAGFNYWALGHIHTREILHTYPHVVYPGNTQGRHARETGAKGCYLIEVSQTKETVLTFIPLDAVRWEEAAVSIANLATEHALLHAVGRAVEEQRLLSQGRPCMIKLKIEGRGPMHRHLVNPVFAQELLEGLRIQFSDEDGGTDKLSQSWCWIYALETRTGVEIDLAALAAEDSFTGQLIRESLELEEDAAAGAAFIEEALAPLLLNPRLRKLLGSKLKDRSPILLQQARELSAGLLTEESETAPAEKRDSGEGDA
ncbi:exonuclease SbcCD subunit D [Paenibacillus solisilvae]|uniref:Exonuclease SbcCD subunit D n=1 Tax=Paenibacillus solisilvae TaxID=2486751 RepID=A0ABW0VU90_9BACL